MFIAQEFPWRRGLYGLALLSVCLSSLPASPPPEPHPASSLAAIGESWRWSELTALRGKSIRCGYEAPDGALWFASDHALLRYDGVTPTAYEYSEEAKKATPIDLYVDQDNTAFLYTNGGFFRLKAGVWTSLAAFGTSFYQYEGTFYHGRQILPVDADHMLVGVPGGLLVFTGDSLSQKLLFGGGAADLEIVGDKLWFAEIGTGALVRVQLQNGLPSLPADWRRYLIGDSTSGITRNLCSDKLGGLWASSVDAKVGALRYRTDQDLWEKIPLDFETGSARYPERWIEAGPEGNIMIRTTDALFYQTGKTWAKLSYPDYDIRRINSFYFWRANGDIVMGSTRSNIYEIQLNEQSWKTFPGLIFQAETDDGRQWFLSRAGEILTLDPTTGQWETLVSPIDTPNSLIQTPDDAIWVAGSDHGEAAIAYRSGDHWQTFHHPELGPRISYLSPYSDHAGNVFFGSGILPAEQRDDLGGIVQYHREGDEYHFVRRLTKGIQRQAATLTSTPDGILWVGSNSLKKVGLADGEMSPETSNRLDKEWVDDTLTDGRSNLWAALWGIGVYRFDGTAWTLFDDNSGLGSNRVVHLVQGRRPDEIIASTNRGLARFDGTQWSEQSLPIELALDRNKGTLAQSRDGAIWLNSFDRTWYNRSADAPVGDSPFRTIRYRPEKQAPVVRIQHFEPTVDTSGNAFFTWTGVDPWTATPAPQLEYSYKIGADPWSKFAPQTTLARSNLKPGAYDFAVRARDLVGNITPSPANIHFQVLPPLWLRPIFLIPALATAILIGLLVAKIISQRIRHARELEAERLKFFTNISHELRNPLSIMVGPLQSALSIVKHPELEVLIGTALKGTKKTIQLVDALLDFRKFEAGSWPTRLTTTDLAEFLRESVETHRLIAQDRGQGLRFTADFPAGTIQFDEEKLTRVVDNLLSNAIKYTPDGGTIDFHLAGESEPDRFVITVTDNGIGIPPAEIANVFEPFHRVQLPPATKPIRGTGLGLPLVYQLVKSMAGQIELQSAPILPIGTRVTVTIPYNRPTPPRTESGAATPGEKTRTILVVEDDPDINAYLARELGSEYHIIQSPNGKDAIEQIHNAMPDLVISDLIMPEMGGLDLCARIKDTDESRHIPVIMLTAAPEDSRLQSHAAGADDYIAKPVDMDVLKLKIQNLFRSREMFIERFKRGFLTPELEIKRPGYSSQNDEFLARAIQTVEAHIADSRFDVEEFSSLMNMSRMTLYRKLKHMTNDSPKSLIQKIRMKKAAELLLADDSTVSEVADQVGFQEVSYFSASFKKHFNCKPSEYRSRAAAMNEI